MKCSGSKVSYWGRRGQARVDNGYHSFWVDHGNMHRGNFRNYGTKDHPLPVTDYFSDTETDIIKWCKETISEKYGENEDPWHMSMHYLGATMFMYFRYDEDATMFVLRWGHL